MKQKKKKRNKGRKRKEKKYCSKFHNTTAFVKNMILIKMSKPNAVRNISPLITE
jgi:hypothetical protein